MWCVILKLLKPKKKRKKKKTVNEARGKKTFHTRHQWWKYWLTPYQNHWYKHSQSWIKYSVKIFLFLEMRWKTFCKWKKARGIHYQQTYSIRSANGSSSSWTEMIPEANLNLQEGMKSRTCLICKSIKDSTLILYYFF